MKTQSVPLEVGRCARHYRLVAQAIVSAISGSLAVLASLAALGVMAWASHPNAPALSFLGFAAVSFGVALIASVSPSEIRVTELANGVAYIRGFGDGYLDRMARRVHVPVDVAAMPRVDDAAVSRSDVD